MGGRGGRILRVTTLAGDGPGSLRAALAAPGPRTAVFEVGGVIDLAGHSQRISEPFVTIAGQTAPSPGITRVRGGIDIASHDVTVQHLRVRPGAWGRAPRSGGDQDGLATGRGAHHVIVDHCSFSWATDENPSASVPRFDGADAAAWRRATSHQVTFSHSLVYERLSASAHAKGEHSKGTLIHDHADGVLLLGNVHISKRELNALFKGGAQGAMVDNLIFNPGRRAVQYQLRNAGWAGRGAITGRLALVGSVLQHGPDTPAQTPPMAIGGDGDLELHEDDNPAFDAEGRPAPQQARCGTGHGRVLAALPAAALAQRLPALVAARPWDRDAVDARVLAGLAQGRGRIVDDERQVEGLPPVREPVRRAIDAAAWQRSDMSPAAG